MPPLQQRIMSKDGQRLTHQRHRQRQAAVITSANFYFGALIGEGLYGKVFHAKYKPKNCKQNIDVSFICRQSLALPQSHIPHCQNDGHIAIKVMDKLHLMKTNRAAMVLRERKILSKLSRAIDITNNETDEERSLQTPWIARLQLSFVDAHNLYLVMDLGTCGTLTDLVCSPNRNTSSSANTAISGSVNTRSRCEKDIDKFKLSIASIKHYASQVLCAIEFVHSHGIVHGDIKPCNILITSEGRIQLIDFGCAVDIGISSPSDMNVVASGKNPNAPYSSNKEATVDGSTPILASPKLEFQGTADYLAPEVITGKVGNGACVSDTFGIDLWSYGCLIYFMFVGKSPFHSDSDHITFQKILLFAKDSELASVSDSVPLTENTGTVAGGHLNNVNSSSPRVEIGKLKEPSAIDLMTKLLVSDPSKRSSLGRSDLPSPPPIPTVEKGFAYSSIRCHDFWEKGFFEYPNRNDSSGKESEGDSINITKPSIKVHLQTDVGQMMDGGNLPFDFF